MKLTAPQKRALIATRDLGSPWAYKMDKANEYGVTVMSYPATTSRRRCIDSLRHAGMIGCDENRRDVLTEAGRAALEA